VVHSALEEYLTTHRSVLAESFAQAQRAIVSGDVAALAAIASGASQRRAQAAVNSHGEL
jgi:hypothetical protein